MGYITSYELTIIGDVENIAMDELRKSNDYAAYALDDYGDTNESCKWHEHEKELKDFSKTKPNLIFKLDGNGQKNGDIWTKYFKGGKMQVCKAVISVDGFNETLLK